MTACREPRLSRREVVLGLGTLPIVKAGYFAGNRLPGTQDRQSAGKTPIIRGKDLGLRPDPRKDQTRALLDALREAADKRAWLLLDDGDYVIGELEAYLPVRLAGSQRTRLRLRRGSRFLMAVENAVVSLRQITFSGENGGYDQEPLVHIQDCRRLSVKACRFQSFDGSGLVLHKCRGVIGSNRFHNLTDAAIFSTDGQALRITGNTVRTCGNNGILVWQGDKRRDGSIVENNDIADINNRSGGDGPYGNGINVYRAGNVIIRRNRIRNCAYSAIRNNSGDRCQILDNNCRDLGEVAIFVEFAWRQAVVRGNRIRKASAGISATNMDHGGRGAIIENNVVEDVRPRIRSVDILGYGISAEADTHIRNNVVRQASDCGITIGWGRFLRNVTASRNRLEDCTYGIGVSVTAGAGRAVLLYNTILRARRGAIVGLNHGKPVTGDFLRGTRPPRHIILRGNVAKG